MEDDENDANDNSDNNNSDDESDNNNANNTSICNDGEFCKTLGLASISLDNMTTTYDETCSKLNYLGYSAYNLMSPQHLLPTPPILTVSASATTIKITKQQDYEYGCLHWMACYFTRCLY